VVPLRGDASLNVSRRRGLLTLLAVAVGGRVMAERPLMAAGLQLSNAPGAAIHVAGAPFPSLEGGTGWLNGPPLSAEALRGKVVLVDFWTYTCINWRRQLPYVRAWAEKYKSQGLVVIGVHTPEFPFEKDVANVRQAVQDMGVPYPVVLDSDYAIWRRFENEYWPALYFIDAAGRIRHRRFGEGDYGRSEKVLQRLLAEAGHGDAGRGLVAVHGVGAEAAADTDELRSPETYIGFGHGGNAAAVLSGRAASGSGASRLRLNDWSLSGDWSVHAGVAVLDRADGGIAYRFHARDVHLVMGPTKRRSAIRFRLSLDGAAPGAAHGLDVDAEGNGTVTSPRMYQLLRQPVPIRDRLLEIRFLDPGLEAYSFTFG
jgi:thiol-disulfide isomerase/thioredoxin